MPDLKQNAQPPLYVPETLTGMAPACRSLNALRDGFQRLVLASCTILFLSACLDGYPTEDEVGLTAIEMSQPQRLVAMNELGQEAHPDLTWLYRAMPGCSLQWTVHRADAGKETVHLPMSGVGIDLSFDKVDRIYSVQVRPAEAAGLNELTVLQSTHWIDAIEMRLLLRWFQISCAASSTAVPRGNAGAS